MVTHKLLMGKAEKTFMFEATPPLGPRATIGITQLTKPKFEYHGIRISPQENSTLVAIEGADPSPREAYYYMRQLTSERANPRKSRRRVVDSPFAWFESFSPAIYGHLISRLIPEMEPERSLFAQRYEAIETARENVPQIQPFLISDKSVVDMTIRGLLGVAGMYGPMRRWIERTGATESAAIVEDTGKFNHLVQFVAGEVADPYNSHEAGLVVKRVGMGGLATAKLVKEGDVLKVGVACLGRKDLKEAISTVGVLYPDGSLHSFSGMQGAVLRYKNPRKRGAEDLDVFLFGEDSTAFDDHKIVDAVRPIAVARLGAPEATAA